uniref:Uncharacterized protein n=1 Tax=Nymphaea colorata TaxID=210225 RepID=A0A5K0UYG4_9MAGN
MPIPKNISHLPATISAGDERDLLDEGLTTLSEYQKDAHTSVYTIRQGKLLNPEQKANPETYADCISIGACAGCPTVGMSS